MIFGILIIGFAVLYLLMLFYEYFTRYEREFYLLLETKKFKVIGNIFLNEEMAQAAKEKNEAEIEDTKFEIKKVKLTLEK